MADNSYSAGDLSLEISGYSDKATASIDKTVISLNALSRAITKVNEANIALAGSKLENLFRKIANATNSINTDNLDRLAISAKSLASISKIGNLSKMDFTKVGDGFEYLSEKIAPFLAQVREAEASLVSLYGIVGKSGKITNITQPYQGKSGFNFLNLGKWMAVLYTARKLGKVVADITKSGADYVETLNLWEVAMGEYTDKATVFVNKMNEAYGISEKTLMNAQATFKNMLGSLGNLSDEMAYSLSESVTRMAVDYASLYNVGIEEAMTKFQAALAGQVRPIRSVSGYDITENTLYQLYQSIGGTKTIRQLSQTEKRLLSIYAIFNQMQGSGALGDMSKTIETFANQSRIMQESWDRTASYAGLIITKLLQTFGVMKNINAVLIFTSSLLKATADYMGAIESQGGDPFASTQESAEDASKAVDELQGKLLGFDKFRSLQGTEESDVSIDQALADAMASYENSMKGSSFEAQKIAQSWLKTIGLIYDAETGAVTVEKEFERIYHLMKLVGSAFLGIVSILGAKGIYGLIIKIAGSSGKLANILTKTFSVKNIGIIAVAAALYYMYTTNEQFRKSVDKLLNVLMSALSSVIEPIGEVLGIIAIVLAEILDLLAPMIADILNGVTAIISFLDEANLIAPMLYAILTAVALFKMQKWVSSIGLLIESFSGLKSILAKLLTQMQLTNVIGFGVLIVGISSLVSIMENWGDMSTWQKVIGLLGAVTVAALGAAIAFGAFHSAWSLGLAAAGITAGIIAITAALNNTKKDIDNMEISMHADGGFPDKGTMFIAGEAGAEYVYDMPNGQSGVANIQQIAQATYQGTTSALRDWWGGMSAKNDIPQLTEANATGMYQAVTGVAKSYGKKWSNY